MYEARLYDGHSHACSTATQPSRRSSAQVLCSGARGSYAAKDARARLQTRTGGVKTTREGDDSDILAGYPKPIQWLAALLLGLTMSGILPMALAAAAETFFDTFNCWWLLFVLLVVELWTICKLVLR